MRVHVAANQKDKRDLSFCGAYGIY